MHHRSTLKQTNKKHKNLNKTKKIESSGRIELNKRQNIKKDVYILL